VTPPEPPSPVPEPAGPSRHAELKADLISQNVEAVLAFYAKEERKMTPAQRLLERVSGFLGQPRYLVFMLLFVPAWMLANGVAASLGCRYHDAPPYPWLQGLIGLGALVTGTVVLINQNRLGRVEEQRAHLDLQVNLLSEQKATKLISLLEELRRDLPNVKNRTDPEASAFQQPTDPHEVLAALDELRENRDEEPPPGTVEIPNPKKVAQHI
jgi:uncharacterized membrane protein